MADVLTTATAATTEVVADDAVPAGPPKRRGFGVGFWIAVALVGVIFGMCLLEPWLPFRDYRLPDTANVKVAFSADHWLGTDNLGRDNLARIAYGGRTSLLIGVSVTLLGFFFGGLVGLIAGYFRGWIERIVMAVVDVFLAFPALVFALALISVISGDEGTTVPAVIASLTILAIPPLARITRATTLQFSQREFVTASRSLGAKHPRIIFKEILPNVIPPMLSFALVVLAIVIVAEAALSFIGAGLPKDDYPTWGNMIADGRTGPNALEQHGSVALTPAFVLFLTVLCLNLIGDKLRARFDVKEAGI